MLRRCRMASLGAGLVVMFGLAACTQDIALPEVSPVDTGVGSSSSRDGGRDIQLVSPGKDAAVDNREPDGRSDRNTPDAEARCEGRSVRFQHPRVILALDRSSSMQERPASGGSSRLHGVQHVLESLIYRYSRAVYFGYVEFPIADCPVGTCCASRVITPGKESLSTIQRRWACELQPASCQSTTKDSPVAEALMASRRDFETGGSEFDQRHLFLMTDGEPSCSASAMDDQCNRSSQEVVRLKTDSNVDVTVFALSEALQTSACLTDLADRGGTTAPIVAATNEVLKEQLEAKLLPLAKDACSFRLNSSLGGNEYLEIWLNGKFVKRDPARMDGWDFEDGAPGKVTFHGYWCTQLSTSMVNSYWVDACRPG